MRLAPHKLIAAALAAAVMFCGVAHAQYNYPLTVGTSPTAVLTANPARKRLVFINPSATATIAFCPTQVRSAVVACAVNGAGSITLLPYAVFELNTTASSTSAYNAVASGASTPITILEFE